jgi:hypothetical protein
LSSASELVLAEEQDVLYRVSAGREIEGTLVLTNERLLFVVGKQEEDLQFGRRMRFTDVEDLNSIPQDPSNLSIPLASIEMDKGSAGILRKPELKVKWNDSGKDRSAEFVETLLGSRKKNLNDWAKLIGRLKSGEARLAIPSNVPGRDKLEGKILYVLADYQEKGPLEIESEVEKQFSIDLDPDAVEASCENLRTLGLVIRRHSYGLDSYKKVSPLAPENSVE